MYVCIYIQDRHGRVTAQDVVAPIYIRVQVRTVFLESSYYSDGPRQNCCMLYVLFSATIPPFPPFQHFQM